MIASHIIRFSRKEAGPYEHGIAIVTSPGTSDPIVIVDAQGKIVSFDDVWSYALRAYMGTIVLPSEDDL